ncbi:MAG: SRPBCC family protein [Flavobacteriaceae bacterium]
MKFNYTVTIQQPIDVVVQAFEDPEVMKICQDGFKEIIPISEQQGEKGATAKFIYDKFELIETIIEHNLPGVFIGHYEHKYSSNTMKVCFKAIDDSTTEYYTEIDYLEFRGVFMKTMAFIAPSWFKTQVKKWVDRFKVHLETRS